MFISCVNLVFSFPRDISIITKNFKYFTVLMLMYKFGIIGKV